MFRTIRFHYINDFSSAVYFLINILIFFTSDSEIHFFPNLVYTEYEISRFDIHHVSKANNFRINTVLHHYLDLYHFTE